jgi:diguanylate cyclase (GGDEF)-like protein
VITESDPQHLTIPRFLIVVVVLGAFFLLRWRELSQEVTVRKALEEQLRHQAFHDPLTKLPNRVLLMDRLEQALARTARTEKPVALLFVDLDNFKFINDSLGHEQGDQLLCGVADRLKACFRPEDTVARIFGDEFTILLEGTGSPTYATQSAERVIETLQSPFVLGGQEVFATPSIGIAFTNSTSKDQPEQLMHRADLAMYAAKRAGKGQYRIFDPSMNEQALERLKLENDLRQAIEKNEFRVYYQPIVLLKSGKVVGMEALLRWEHPQHGLLLPSKFISLAEESGMLVPIGHWVLEEACRQAKGWQEHHAFEPSLKVWVNLSGKQLHQLTLVQDIDEVLQKSGLHTSGLGLEITEDVVMEEADLVIGTLEELKSLGVELVIDDFGTGYSSLAYLKRFPVDTLKVDRSFIEGLGKDRNDTMIVSATISLAHALGMKVVAEGVGTAEQLEHLRELGCDLVQGHYFTQPLAAEAASAFLATNLR